MPADLEEADRDVSEIPHSRLRLQISTLDPEPLDLVSPISVVIEESDGSFIATFLEASLAASGDTEAEAIEGLKDRIITTFERLKSKHDNQLGPVPLRQKQILTSLIQSR
jgi:hypothetical protein